ncbi:MAG: penicillin-binding protein activator LpoB [Verrucomicrobiia bacterium]|jgi:PBP1b-binding outer membrane lipoprotein LpoB
MSKNKFHWASVGATFISLAIFTGCSTTQGVKNPSGVPVTEMRADERGFVAGTGVESQDIAMVTDKMARSILSVPQIANATTPPMIILDPVNNNTRFAINKDIFLKRLRVMLNSKTRGKVSFLARERMAALENERALKQAGQVTSTGDPNAVEFKGANFILTGELQGHTTTTGAGVSDYIMYTFQLIDVRTSQIVWEDFAEMKKQGLGDAVYR